jgi:beta-lactamase regulating signal transducer with metallopeptidase domain
MNVVKRIVLFVWIFVFILCLLTGYFIFLSFQGKVSLKQNIIRSDSRGVVLKQVQNDIYKHIERR